MMCGHIENIYKTLDGFLEGSLTEKYWKGIQTAKMIL